MRVSTLIRQLEFLNKHHANASVSVVTKSNWYQTQQVIGIRHDPDNDLVVLYQQELREAQHGFRVYELSRMLTSSAESNWHVVLDGPAAEQVVAVTLFDGSSRSSTFLNDLGEPATVAFDEADTCHISTFAPIPLVLLDRVYSLAAYTEGDLDLMDLYQAARELRTLVYGSLGLQP